MTGKSFITPSCFSFLLLCALYLTLTQAASQVSEQQKESDRQSFAGNFQAAESLSQSISVIELDEEKMRAIVRRGQGRSGGAKPLLLYLWYTDCEPCRARFKDVERIHREFRQRGLDVITVAVAPMDNREKLSRYFATQSPEVPIYLLKELNDELAEEIFQKDWEVTVPSVFGYDAKGQVIFMHTRIDDDYYAVLKRAAEQMLTQAAR